MRDGQTATLELEPQPWQQQFAERVELYPPAVLQDRVERVRVLLETLDDYLPGPTSSRLASQPGLAPAKRVPCEFCHRTGRLHYEGDLVLTCGVCDGTGWRRRRKDDEAWDEYVQAPIAEEGDRKPRVATTAELEAIIARARAAERSRAGDHSHEREAWEVKRERLEREGSYRALRRCLTQLRSERPELYAALSLDLSGLPVDRTGEFAARVDAGLAWLAYRMPGRIRIPNEDSDLHRRRVKSVMECVAAGMRSATSIAKRTGIERAKVKKILEAHQLRAGAVMAGA